MRVRLSVLCGGLFVAAAAVAGAVTIADAPSRAMRDLRQRLTACALPGLKCAPPNTCLHQRETTAPLDRAFGRPDPLMLVSSAWVDLSAGPIRLDIPVNANRFFTVQVIDERDETIALAGSSTTGQDNGRLLLAGPSAREIGPNAVRAPTEWVWVVARFAVADEADTAAVHEQQNALRLTRQ